MPQEPTDARSPWERYQIALKKNPLEFVQPTGFDSTSSDRTKAITSAAMGAIGEVAAHYLKHKTLHGLSLRRLMAFAFYGGAITAPVMHFWYGFLEQVRVEGERLTSNGKLLLDRLLLTPPFLAATLFSLSVLTGASTDASRALLRKNYITALWMNWKVWTFTQYISFHYVPAHLRVLWGTTPIISASSGCIIGNAVAVWWNCYLSLSSP
ncbi:hypothetical protein ACHHYP_03102 [Achlya hypogyna]|uniref:Peroxisomal membrane protein n=1 Tax=Achlya hypogyna TaxID=1202772 RepID=A0A1V9Z519_ACHHY|nr:hypothetical protein ACHHYP_03102 [Achlya hypogyna]